MSEEVKFHIAKNEEHSAEAQSAAFETVRIINEAAAAVLKKKSYDLVIGMDRIDLIRRLATGGNLDIFENQGLVIPPEFKKKKPVGFDMSSCDVVVSVGPTPPGKKYMGTGQPALYIALLNIENATVRIDRATPNIQPVDMSKSLVEIMVTNKDNNSDSSNPSGQLWTQTVKVTPDVPFPKFQNTPADTPSFLLPSYISGAFRYPINEAKINATLTEKLGQIIRDNGPIEGPENKRTPVLLNRIAYTVIPDIGLGIRFIR